MRKYDKRVNNRFAHPNQQEGRKRTHKPKWAKNLTRNTAAVVLKEQNAKELWANLLATNDAKLRFEVLRYLTDRLEGRPFVQTDPALVNKPATVNNDNRLQIAIQQLIPGAKPSKRSKKALVSGNSDHEQVIEAEGVSPAGVDLGAGVE